MIRLPFVIRQSPAAPFPPAHESFQVAWGFLLSRQEHSLPKEMGTNLA